MNFAPDLIMNLAAESHVDTSINAPARFIETNIIGTFNLLQSLKHYYSANSKNPNEVRFHQISTDEVYGDLDSDFQNAQEKSKFNEKTAYAPSSPYSASKASADHLVRAWGRTYNIPTLITTCSNNYGPYQHREKLFLK